MDNFLNGDFMKRYFLCGGCRFVTIEGALNYANEVYSSEGIVLGIQLILE